MGAGNAHLAPTLLCAPKGRRGRKGQGPMRCLPTLALALAAILGLARASAGELPPVRVGVLKFGTVNWELDVLRRYGLDRAHGIEVRPLELAGKAGAAVALQGGAVDVILTDWLWVARRRALGGDYTFVPHSHATGGLMVRKADGITGIADL